MKKTTFAYNPKTVEVFFVGTEQYVVHSNTIKRTDGLPFSVKTMFGSSVSDGQRYDSIVVNEEHSEFMYNQFVLPTLPISLVQIKEKSGVTLSHNTKDIFCKDLRLEALGDGASINFMDHSTFNKMFISTAKEAHVSIKRSMIETCGIEVAKGGNVLFGKESRALSSAIRVLGFGCVDIASRHFENVSIVKSGHCSVKINGIYR